MTIRRSEVSAPPNHDESACARFPLYSSRKVQRRAWLATAAVLLVFGCTSPAERILQAKPEGPLALYDDPGTGLDPSINPNDTYVVTSASVQSTITVSSSTPMLDPNTGGTTNSFTYTSPAESFQLTAGYTTSRTPVAVADYTQDPTLQLGGSELGKTRTIGSVSSDYNALGAPLYPAEYETLEGRDSLGTVVLTASLLTDGLVGGVSPPPTACAVSCGYLQATRTQLDDSTIVISSPPQALTALSARSVSTNTTYRLSSTGRWRIAKLVTRAVSTSSGAQVASVTAMSLRVTREHINATLDRERHERLANGRVDVAPASWVTGKNEVPSLSASATSAADPIPQLRGRTCGPQPYAGVHAPVVAGGDGLVLAHGILSDACTWYRMEKNRIGTHYAWGQRVVENTTSTAPYDTQRDELIAKMPTSTTNYVLIGHSNGGIVSRRVAQLAKATGARSVRGVITVGSPHLGAPLVDGPLGPAVALLTAAGTARAWLCASNKRGCGEVQALTSGNGLVQYANSISNTGPLSSQLSPTSAFRNTLASGSEPFIKSAVVSHSPNRWLFMRLLGDRQCYPDDPTCGGRARAAGTDRFYRHLRRTAIISAITGTMASLFGATVPLAGPAFELAIEAGGMMVFLDMVDKATRLWVIRSNDSDGVVPASSQFYPNVPLNLQQQIFGADTHVGETSSPQVGDKLDAILQSGQLFNKGFRK